MFETFSSQLLFSVPDYGNKSEKRSRHHKINKNLSRHPSVLEDYGFAPWVVIQEQCQV